jgi:hypothetical protein
MKNYIDYSDVIELVPADVEDVAAYLAPTINLPQAA